MKTKQQVEREFREALQRLVDEYSAELETMDHWEGHPECGQDVVHRSSCAARSRRRSVRTNGGLDDDV